jgi:aldehyde dehydrogenase (NAD+)
MRDEKMLELNDFYVNGAWRRTQSTALHTLVEAWSEKTYGSVALASRADVDEAVAAAHAALPGWAATAPAERIAIVQRIHDLYLKRADDMAQAISREMGAPIDLARGAQVPLGGRQIANFLAAVENFEFVREVGPHAPTSRIVMEPIGVAALITPWNWPISQIALKVIAGLLAGCTLVLKPSEYAPLSANLFASILHDAGVPPGVFNLVHGDGAGAGTWLSSHPDVAMVSFTGSTRAGVAVSIAAAATLKRVALELGGKGANLIFADADEMAVERGIRQCFNNSGQSCNAPTRMLVERSVYKRAVETAARVAASVVVGPSDQPGAHVGPVISERQWARVQSLIEKGVAEGARLVAGGPGRPEGNSKGFFVRPTVFADVSNDMTIAQEEIFGPVLSIIPFDTEDEAVRIANDTPYGLSNYVQSADVARRQRLARRLDAGMIEMNGQPRGAGAPFGGVKGSGRAREGGRMGLEEFMDAKAVSAWI